MYAKITDNILNVAMTIDDSKIFHNLLAEKEHMILLIEICFLDAVSQKNKLKTMSSLFVLNHHSFFHHQNYSNNKLMNNNYDINIFLF